MRTANEPAVPAPSVESTHLLTLRIQVERKHITFDLRENLRGEHLRITEEVSGRRNSIIIPLPGLEQFRDALNEVMDFNKTSAKTAWPLPNVPRTPR